MSQVLHQYKALSTSTSRDQASATFIAILLALTANQLDPGSRKTLAQLILDDLRAVLLDNTISRLSKDDAPRAFSTLKGLGSTPEVANILGTPSNLRCLLKLSTKIDNSPQNDALRCIANTILLNEPSRVTFVGPGVDGGNVCIDLLQKSSTEHVFLASRILFLCTAAVSSAVPFIQWLVEHKRPDVPGSGTAIDIIGSKLDDLVELMKEENPAAKDAITDLLKLIFNLCVHYPKVCDTLHGLCWYRFVSQLVECEVQSPEVTISTVDKVMGDYWSTRLDSLLPPLLRAFHSNHTSTNPLETPLPHIIHSLITVPILPTNRNLWFGKHPSVPTLPDSASSSSAGSNSRDTYTSFKETKTRLFERASSVLSAGRRSLSRSSTSTHQDSALRAFELLDATFAYFMPGDINSDDPSIRSRLPDGETLDDLVSPLLILITRFCLGDEEVKVRMRNWFIPPSLDRTEPLETRSDLLGRCLRLLQSVYHSRLNRLCGEMFFAMCDCDATTLSGYLGYGNVAGFLFQKGMASVPARSSTSGAPTITAAGFPINPITGTIEKELEPIPMTDEEKEQEAEKLFVLFERLEKTGTLSRNPIRMAIQEGKLGQH
ncbi:guanine nucleotide exchange factor [Lanmaoa asiatica]|nr:guanine nucleotide exchange factor [Lanmaoa asiatica]